MRPTTVVPAGMAVGGAALLGAWGTFVLPLIAVSPGAVPGKELQALALSVLPPLSGSGLLLAGGLVGLTRRRGAGAGAASPGSVLFAAVAAAGALAAVYTLLLLRAVV